MSAAPPPRSAAPVTALVTALVTGLVTVLVTALALTLLPAAPAQAKSRSRPNPCAPSAVAAQKQRISSAISARRSALARLATTLDAWTHVSPDHRDLLNQLITTDSSALSQLGLAVGQQSVCQLVGVDGEQVVGDYRLYSLVLPQTYLTIAADSGTYGAGQLLAAEPALRLLVLRAPVEAQATAQSLWQDLVRQAAAAQTLLTPVGDAVLALSPASYYPDTASALARQAKAVATGAASLDAAIKDAEKLQALT